MKGWNGKILWIDLTSKSVKIQEYDGDFAKTYIGGRGFAVRLLWDHLAPGTDPLSPDNILVIATGPLTGLPGPSTGKLVVAAKSPLTHGYGDGNIGSKAAVYLRYSGYDAVAITGKAEKPTYVHVSDGKVEFLAADDLWGKDTFTSERSLVKRHGRNSGILVIGPAGENLVKLATIISQEGRSGGRPGIGAVMGSKNLKAVVFTGERAPELYDEDKYRRLAARAYAEIKEKPAYSFWMRQGTMMTVQWSQANSVLPTYNFNEGVFDESEKIDGNAMERMKVGQRGCPNCNMTCGNYIYDDKGEVSELDYENVAMLGSNIGLGDLRRVARLNRLADMWGIDTIGLGSVLAFAAEASEKKLIKENVEWGDFDRFVSLSEDIVYRRPGLGEVLAEGVEHASRTIGGEDLAVHVKGLSVSAYDCHTAPAMALSYGVSSIGAHHKDAWVISWEVSHGRFEYTRAKAERVFELQRIRGGLFEVLVSCRLPWVEVGLELDWYINLFNAATGLKWRLEDFMVVSERVLNLIRAFWVREYVAEGKRWSRALDYPPSKWFTRPLTKGPFKGARLDAQRYDEMLGAYYNLIGWDHRGIPRASTLERLGLSDVRDKLGKWVDLTQ
ncbi:aldehyde ferredoxin oxidoreductase family protein [Infirmifilum sp. NZ]|uniref:aldehyde ferredoxin oxidoreductase family protein n=1 Tax=Infirmifilum sp. NZ TaxID=2926850 RepID=UPI0027A958D9|nr:aldehyde ferredoxin oxidoreductase family protein [Infirmifilum sp. NZ]UNQ74064.1 aldehyde ferredoxin oxidoreductase family protein [Infirmifilum sp. NZ]